MYYYQIYELIVQSNIEMPQLISISEISTGYSDIEIIVDECDDLAPTIQELFAGEKYYGKTLNGVWFNNQVGKFLVETIGLKSYVKCTKYKDVHMNQIRNFLLGNCMALALTQRKKLILHGSTLILRDKTFLICGNSGAGKSTLSTALIRDGARFLTDDISVLDMEDDGLYAYPGFPEQKISKEVAMKNGLELDKLRPANDEKGKYSVNRRDIFENNKAKLDAMYVIHCNKRGIAQNKCMKEGVLSCKVIGADKVNAITNNFFLKEIYGKLLFLPPEEMLKCIKLAEQISIIDITRDSKLDTVEKMKEIIVETL